MSTYVKISTIGYRPPCIDPDTPLDETVGRVIEFLDAKFARVLPDRPDLIVIPEACDRPGGWPKPRVRELYEARGDRVLQHLAGVAREHRCYVTYPASRKLPDGTWRNSVVLLDRQGGVAGIYNKNHLVIEENTEAGCLYGKDPTLIECDFGTVGCAICFDLNFDEVRLKIKALKPDLLLFCSMYHGGLMQPTWAYSCRCHFAAAIAGPPSAILSPVGETIATTTNYIDYVTANVNLDCCLAHLDYNWTKLDALKEKYGAGVKITDPGHLGAVLVSSESEDRSVQDMVEEFEIELLDDYFARALAHRHAPGNIEA